MAGELDQAAVAAPEITPAIEAPVVVEPVQVVEAVVEPAAEAPKLHTETESLLETLGEKPVVVEPEAPKPETEAKPEEAKPEGEVKPAEPEIVQPEPIAYEAFKLPEGIEPVQEQIGKYTEILGKHRIPQEVGQELLDLHTAALSEYAATRAEQTLADQHSAFATVRADWVKQAMGDSQIGGAAWDTAKGVIARSRDLFVSGSKSGTPEYAKDMAEFNDFLRITGAGDHPAFLKFLHNVGRRFDEPGLPPSNIKPSPNNGVAPRRPGLRNIYNKDTTYARDA